MKKYKKIIIIVAVGIVLAIAIGYGLYRALVDENALSISEKKWLDENSSDVISVAIPNDLPVFGMSGAGVFFDFTTYLTDELGININNNTVSYASQNEGYRFEITTEYDPDGLFSPIIFAFFVTNSFISFLYSVNFATSVVLFNNSTFWSI